MVLDIQTGLKEFGVEWSGVGETPLPLIDRKLENDIRENSRKEDKEKLFSAFRQQQKRPMHSDSA